MKLKRLKLSVLLILVFGIGSTYAQTSVNSSGANASGSNGSVSYSVGQVFNSDSFGSNGSISEGVQQAYEISVLTNSDASNIIKLFVTAYPNPTTDYLTLEVLEYEKLNLSYELFDINGKLLQSVEITNNQTSIEMNDLIAATYFVKVYQDDKELKTFKIIKN